MPDAPPVTIARRRGSPAILRRSKDLTLTPKSVYLKFDDVTGAKVRMIGQTEGNAMGGAGVDDVTRSKNEKLAQVPDKV
jgi:hypothetical protein